MIPILYEKNEKVFNTLGLGALRDIIKPIVREERNGLFEMEFKYPINSPLFIDLTYGRIVVADASPKLKNQRFVIVRIEADDEGIAHFYCEHIAQFKAKNTTLKPIVNAIDVNAWQALDNWNKSLLGDVTFNVTSDITTISTIKWNISKVKNARLALGGVEGSILDKYHGEYRFDNMNINLMKSRGQNLGAYIAYGKNLTSLSQDLEIENTYTSIQPFVVYMDNIEKVDSSGKVTFESIEKTLVLTEHVLHSEYVNNYPQALVAAIEFDAKEIMAPEVEYTYKDASGKEVRKPAAQVQEERLKRLQLSEEKLRNRALRYIKDNNIGIPRVKINLTFVDLVKSLEYKGIAKSEEINLCDYVTIDFLNLGINRVTSQVVKVEYNPKLERYEKLTIGEIGSKFQSSVVANKKAIEEVKNQLGTVKEDLNIVRVSADGMTLTFYGPDDPIANNINDKWYKDLGGGDTELRIWDGTIWKFIMSTRDISEAKKAAEDALVKVGEAKSAADKAVAETEQIKANIEDLGDLSTALSQLDDAQTRITDMETQISEAIGNITTDFYGNAPTPPYELHQKWYKTEYTPLADKDTGYESIKNTDNVTLDEFSNAGLFVCINQKAEGQVFNWNDWKRIATDNTDLLQQIEEGYTYDIQQLEKGYRETLLDYAKSTDLNGLATEQYALTVSQTEAGRVSQTLTDYKKTNDSKIENINGRVETTEGNYTTLTQKVDGEVKKLFDVTQTVDGQTTVIKDLTGETGNMSLVEIRQNINEFSSKFVNMPDNITGTVKVDANGVPISPYKKGNVWYKDEYNFTQGYDVIKSTDNVTLDEFANKGVWVAIKDSTNGVFNWNDWQRVSADSSFQLSEIYQDINKIALTVQNNDNNTKSQLLQLSNMIDMTVTKDDLIGQINTQAGNVLIRASADGKSSLLNVTSTGTYIETGIIKNAHIADGAITRVKIGEAAIDTAKIADAAITDAKILNLDVYKVSGLTSEFVQSKWNSINSSVTITGNGMLVDGDWGGSINFTRRGQTFYDKIKGQVMGYQYGLYRNLDDPLVNSQMKGIYLAAEMGYDLTLGIRKQIDNQNNAYMTIKSAGGTTTAADIWGETRLYKGVRTNNQIFYATNDAGSGIKIGAGQALDNWVTTITNAEGTAGIGFTAGGGVMIRRYDSAAGVSAWKWL